MLRWKVWAGIVGLGLFGGLWLAANALISSPEPSLGELIQVSMPQSPATETDKPVSPTPPRLATSGATPVDTPQSCFAGPDDDTDDDDDGDDYCDDEHDDVDDDGDADDDDDDD